MLERLFGLKAHGTDARTAVLAGSALFVARFVYLAKG
jgi:xanthine/uracil/vitamin C permease (AzgA family)